MKLAYCYIGKENEESGAKIKRDRVSVNEREKVRRRIEQARVALKLLKAA